LRTKPIQVKSIIRAVGLATQLIKRSACFEFEPLPDDNYEFRVKEEYLPAALLLLERVAKDMEAVHDIKDMLVLLAEKNGWTARTLCEAFVIDPDNTNNGGVAEVLQIVLDGGDDIDWITRMVSAKPNPGS